MFPSQSQQAVHESKSTLCETTCKIIQGDAILSWNPMLVSACLNQGCERLSHRRLGARHKLEYNKQSRCGHLLRLKAWLFSVALRLCRDPSMLRHKLRSFFSLKALRSPGTWHIMKVNWQSLNAFESQLELGLLWKHGQITWLSCKPRSVKFVR